MLVSLIIPCYNEEKAIPFLYDELCRVTEKLGNYNFEFIFVDDGSKDRTTEVVKGYANNDLRVKYVTFARNFGKESAMYAGFCNAKGDYVAVMDADMQDPPSLLPEMLEILEKGEYDSVATRRVTRKGEPHLRSFFARMFYKIINRFSDADIVDGARDFHLMSRAMADVIVDMKEYSRFSKGIYGWIGYRTYWLPYENIERVAGETKWNFWKLFKYSIDGIINFSEAPIALPTGLSILGMIASVIMFCIYFATGFINNVLLICSVLVLLFAMQTFCIGVIGKYIAKMYFECKKRPHYTVLETNI